MVEPEGIDNRALGVFVAMGSVVTIVLIYLAAAFFYDVANADAVRKRDEIVGREVRDIESAQLADMKSYSWVDREARTVALPIERAMELVVREEAARKRRRGRGEQE